MELKEFIKETLTQITEGVMQAQRTESGSEVNAQTRANVAFGGNLINVGDYGMFTRVDFDVAISAETSGGGEVKLTVFGVGAEGGGKRRTEASNRISFAVPLRLPDGDVNRAESATRKEQKEISKNWIIR